MTNLGEHYWNKVAESDCWIWVGATNGKGYGTFWHEGKIELAHRLAYIDAYGRIPRGKVIDHKCRVRNCVRPEHLEAVTTRENNARGRVAGGLAVGTICCHGHAIRTIDDLYVRENASTECRECRRSSPHRVTVARSITVGPLAGTA